MTASRDALRGERSEPARASALSKIPLAWSRVWMLFAGRSLGGRAATRLAALTCPPYYGRHRLARYSARGYVDPRARIAHSALELGRNVYLGEGVVVYADGGGSVGLGDRAHLNDHVYLQTGPAASIRIGADTHVQPHCQFSAYVADIELGRDVQVAPGCSFYSYDHGTAAGVPMREQELTSKGPIRIGDDVWIGVGVIVLSGVTVGEGAVIGAGAVVTSDIPAGAIAAGVPARVVRRRGG